MKKSCENCKHSEKKMDEVPCVKCNIFCLLEDCWERYSKSEIAIKLYEKIKGCDKS